MECFLDLLKGYLGRKTCFYAGDVGPSLFDHFGLDLNQFSNKKKNIQYIQMNYQIKFNFVRRFGAPICR